MKNLIVVDNNNRLILDVDGRNMVFAEEGVEVDFFEHDVRVRIKQDIIANNDKAIKIEFREDEELDAVIPKFVSNNNG